MDKEFMNDLQKRGDLAVESIRIVLEELGLALAYKDGDLIFADKKIYMEQGKKVSVATRIGNVNITKFDSVKDIPEHILETQSKLNKTYKGLLKDE